MLLLHSKTLADWQAESCNVANERGILVNSRNRGAAVELGGKEERRDPGEASSNNSGYGHRGTPLQSDRMKVRMRGLGIPHTVIRVRTLFVTAQ
jgi:hypothetical protein